MEINEITGEIVRASMRAHTALGPGLLEGTYRVCVRYELENRGLKVEQERVLPVMYRDVEIQTGYRVDLLVENAVIVELKSVARLLPLHQAQLLGYLKLSQRRVGLLINFNVVHLRQGIKRMVV